MKWLEDLFVNRSVDFVRSDRETRSKYKNFLLYTMLFRAFFKWMFVFLDYSVC